VNNQLWKNRTAVDVTKELLDFANTPEDFRGICEKYGVMILNENPWISTKGDSRITFTILNPYPYGKYWQQYSDFGNDTASGIRYSLCHSVKRLKDNKK
jgi:hypothetical protein